MVCRARFLTLGLIFAILLIAPFQYACSPPASQVITRRSLPDSVDGADIAIVEGEDIDLGAVSFGATRRITIINNGNEPLRIFNLAARYSLLSASANRSVIPPGDTTSIALTLIKEKQKGLRFEHIEIVSNAVERSRIALWVRMVAVPEYKVGSNIILDPREAEDDQ